MALERVRIELGLFFRERFFLFLFFFLVFGMGILYGTGSLHSLPLKERLFGIGDLDRLFYTLRGIDGRPSLLFRDLFYNQMVQLSLFYLLGLSLLGLPLLPLLVFFRGFVMGFTVGFLLEELSFLGFILALLAVVPQNLIILPTILLASVSGVVFTLGIIQTYRGYGDRSILKNFMSYTLLFLLCALLLFLATLIEAYLVPVLLRILFFLFF